MAENVGGVVIDIRGDTLSYEQAMRRVDRRAETSGRKVSETFRKSERSVASFNREIRGAAASMGALTAALGGGAAIALGTRTLADFGQAMSTVKAITGATAEEFARLQAEAQRLGGSTRFSATEAAEGLIFLSRAGFSVDEALVSLEDTLLLAQAGGLELGTAADIASNALQGFRLEADEAGRVVDVLALAANSSNTSVEQLGQALSFVAPVAAGLNVSVEETAAAISALSDAGIQSERAGTGLRRVLIGLEKQTKEGETVLKRYGLEMKDLSLSSNTLEESLGRLARAQVSTADAITLFGQRGGPALAVLQDSVDKLARLSGEYEGAAGSAREFARVQDQNLKGAILEASAALERLTLSFGELGADAALTGAFRSLADLLQTAAENADLVSAALIALAARAALPLATALISRLAPNAATASAALFNMATAASTTSNAIGLATVATRGFGLALKAAFTSPTVLVLGAAAAFVAIQRAARKAEERIEDIEATIREASAALAETKDLVDRGNPIDEVGDAAEGAVAKVEGLVEQLGALADGLSAVREEAAVAALLRLKNSYDDVTRQVEELEAKRERLARAPVGPNTGDSGRRRLREFDEGEEGDLLLQLRQERALLERRIKALAGEVDLRALGDRFLDGYFNRATEATTTAADELTDAEREARSQALERLRVEQQIALARARGDDLQADTLQLELDVRKRALEYQELGIAKEEALARARRELGAIFLAENSQREEAIELADREKQIAQKLGRERRELLDELEVARAAGHEEEIERLERELQLSQRIANYKRLGFSAEEAGRLAREQQRRVDEASSDADLSDFEANLREATKSGLEDALKTGDYGTFLADTIYDAASDGFSRAVSTLVDELFDVLGATLRQIFNNTDLSGGSGGGGIFAALASSFGGFRAGGGSVSASKSYVVGEDGPELFVPDVSGDILPNGFLANMSAGRRRMRTAVVGGPQIIIQGDASEKTVRLIEQRLAEHQRQLPDLVTGVVLDGQNRGRF